jgi:cytochrome b
MSASNRTVQQQALGTNPLGAALAVVALIIIVAAAIAFGSLGATKPAVAPAAVGAPLTYGVPPDAREHQVAAPVAPVTYGGTNGYAGPSSKDVHDGNRKNSVNVGTKRPGLRPD